VLLAPQDSRRSSEVSQTSIWDFCASSVTSGLAEVFHHQGVTKGQWNLPLIGHVYIKGKTILLCTRTFSNTGM